MHRRTFIRTAVATGFITALARPFTFAQGTGEIPKRVLGKTGEKVSLVGIGGFHIGQKFVTDDTAIKIVRTAIDAGVNFMDNCWDYNDGRSEELMGKALRDGYRQKAFLMTKLDSHTAGGATKQLEESLKRLQTDHIDLVQVHENIRPDDAEKVFAKGGSMETLRQAQKDGKLRYIGFTGHKSPAYHLHMIDVADKNGFVFDTVQMPINVMDAHYDSFGKQVIPIAQKHNMGILGMKPLGASIILASKTATAVECLRFTMNMPVSVCITGCDTMKVLDQALDTARNFKPMTDQEVAEILAKTELAAKNGDYEKYKVTEAFDGTKTHPEWLV